MTNWLGVLKDSKNRVLGLQTLVGLGDLIHETCFSEGVSHLVLAAEEELDSLQKFLKFQSKNQACFKLPLQGERERRIWQTQANQSSGIFLTSPRSLLKKSHVKTQPVSLKVGASLPELERLGYKQEELAQSQGSWSRQGLYCDVFSPLHLLHAEVVGDTIENLHLLHPKTRKRIKKISKYDLPSLCEESSGDTCSLNVFPQDAIFWIYDPDNLKQAFEEQACLKDYLSWQELEKRSFLTLKSSSFEKNSTSSYPFRKIPNIQNFLEKESPSLLVWSGKQEEARACLEKISKQALMEKSLFIERELEASYFNEHKSTAYLSIKSTSKSKKPSGNSFEFFEKKFLALNFSELKQGDLVVHKKHGIAKFIDLANLNVGEFFQDFFILEFQEKARLLLPAYRADIIKKYSLSVFKKTNTDLLIDKLGDSRRWQKKRAKAREYVQVLSMELLKLYQARKQLRRPAFGTKDKELLQFKKECDFLETSSQKQAVQEIMEDLDKEYPMDRLLMADVGFGKTEVALQASLRVLENNFQVCFLVPTTILSWQHYKNFQERFKNWPYNLGVLNRFLTTKERRETLQKVRLGQLDLLVTTHSVFNSEVEFKNLGLLILDEEHRFGVAQKEKLRLFKNQLDTLSLSATPLPRTLNQALKKMKSISVIEQAPPGRKAIKTFSEKWSEDLIRRACEFEKNRGGQILFVHNRIQSLQATKEKLQKILPTYKIAMVSGKTPAEKLEKTLFDFFQKKYDLLLSTNIIESGMDIPEMNTLFVDRVEDFGLGQLYQLRGRIGRRDKQGFCYFLLPSKPLKKPAAERLKILEGVQGLGQGFSLALHDMEARGVGNILGQEQSGHLKALGEEFFFDMLKEQLETNAPIVNQEVSIKLPFSIGLPSSYIEDTHIKLLYYKNFSQVTKESELNALRKDLENNFGKIPEETQNLFFLLRIKILALSISIKEIKVSNKFLSLIFYKQSSLCSNKILNQIKNHQWTMSGEYSLKIPILDAENTQEEILSHLELLEEFSAGSEKTRTSFSQIST